MTKKKVNGIKNLHRVRDILYILKEDDSVVAGKNCRGWKDVLLNGKTVELNAGQMQEYFK